MGYKPVVGRELAAYSDLFWTVSAPPPRSREKREKGKKGHKGQQGQQGRTARTPQPGPLSRGGGWGGRERGRGEGLGRGRSQTKLPPTPGEGLRRLGEHHPLPPV